MSKIRFTIGCDPEFFLKKDGNYVSSIPYVMGMKDDPQPIGRGNGAMIDNVAVEFCCPPSLNESKFVRTIKHAIRGLKQILPEDIHLEAIASARFPEKELDHPLANEFGCEPDFNAYKNGGQNCAPQPPDPTFRSAGGHIHVGHPGLKSKKNKIIMIKLMDVIHGLASTILDNSGASVERRKLYGKAGSYRPTEYGVEYRTLSNYWVKSPDLVKLMFRFTRDAVALFVNGKEGIILDSINSKEIQEVINTGDRNKALDLFSKFVAQNLSSHTNELMMEVSSKVYSFESSWN